MPPTVLLNSLENVRKRVRTLGIVYGVGIVLAAAVGLLLLTILIDYFLNLYPAPRVFILLVALGAVGYSLFRWVITPIISKLTLTSVAGRLEQSFPQFNDRLRSTVEFLQSDIPGSEMMKQRVVGETTELASRLNLGTAIVATPAWYSIGGGVAAILIAVLLGSISPKYTSIALTRLFMPFSDQAWPKRVEIELSGALPQRVPVGQRIEVKMKLAKGDAASRKALIKYRYDDGPEMQEYMIRGADGTYVASLDARVDAGKAASSLKIWMESGDDEKALVPIQVVPRLTIKSVEAEITPPAYVTNQPATTVNLVAAPALMVDGSTVKVRVNFSKPLDKDGTAVDLTPASAEMSKPEKITWVRDTNSSAVGTWVARKSLRFHVGAKDVDGFTNNGLEEYELIVRPDQNPTVQIENPRRNEDRTATSIVPLTGLADDDFGLQFVKLVVERAADKKRWDIDLLKDDSAIAGINSSRAEGTADRLRIRLNYMWELSQLKDASLKPGDTLEYYLLAKDNFALDGQTHPEVPSGKLRINIVTPEDLEARVLEDLRVIKSQIQGVRTTVDRNRTETTNLADDTKNRERLDAADLTALDRLINQQATSTSQTKQLAARVNQLRDRLAENRAPSKELSDIARDVANDLEQAAENPMREATNQLSSLNRQNANSPANRNQPNAAQQPNANPATQPQTQGPQPREVGEQSQAASQQNQNAQGQQNPQQANQTSRPQSGQQSPAAQGQQSQAQQNQPGQQAQGQQSQQGQQSPSQQGQQSPSQQGQQAQQQNQQQQPQAPQNPQERGQAMARAVEQQQNASDQLQRAVDRMNNIGSLQETLNRLRNILEQQQQVSKQTRDIGKENLGKTPEQMKPEDREKLNQVAEQQQKLAEQTNQAMQDMQRQSQQMQRSDPQSAQAMQRAAQQGQQQQTSQNQQRASQQARQNQQAQAQQAQRQAELGLQQMVDQLREAEQHKLAELQKQLEEMQNQIANLIRRQAGHNLDNITVQGPEKRDKLYAKMLTDLIEKSERDPANLPPAPQASQLSTPQEQTERNTRDLGKNAENMPDGAEAAANLTRAAGRMERAIVNLRDQKLVEAFDPAQVEALAALEAARAKVDQQKAQADQQAQDQKKDSLRARFVKIRADQQKLNEDTTRTEKARGADGALARADLVRLGQLPGEQGKLAETVKEIDADLSGMGSTVYVWANKDIGDSMVDVKDDLGKQLTGAATQAEQTRIAEQLDAMIRNLATKQNNSRFAQEQQQQRQQQQPPPGQQANRGPRLPSEAELRLLQDLQRAVNKSTITNDQQPQKDKPKLLALGNRQGDLRNLLDELLQKASQGKIKLGAEPDNRDQLPEEARAEAVENQELDKELLQGVPDEQKGAKQASLVGDRMARSRQRLALNNDPGKITQTIQQRIIDDIDGLIQQAQQQQAQTRNPGQQPGQQPGQGQGQANAQRMQQARQQGQQAQNQGQQQAQQNPGNQGANQSNAPDPNSQRREDLTRDIQATDREWGAVSPRLRDAVMEGAGENIIEQYRKLVEEYYRSVGSKGAGQ